MTVTDLAEEPGAASVDPADPAPALMERVVYADWTASGRALDFVEDAIRDRVLPWYANTHTESSATTPPGCASRPAR